MLSNEMHHASQLVHIKYCCVTDSITVTPSNVISVTPSYFTESKVNLLKISIKYINFDIFMNKHLSASGVLYF